MNILENKTAVITGGGGVLCSTMAEHLSLLGCKVAILDLNKSNAQKVADQINQNGGNAIGVEANVLKKDSLEKAHQEVLDHLGPCDILVNGAGGNHPKGTTSKTHFEMNDLDSTEELTTFFDLDPEGIKFVFDLNFIGLSLIHI